MNTIESSEYRQNLHGTLERNRRIKALVGASLTLQEIGDYYHITKERVRQIASRDWIVPDTTNLEQLIGEIKERQTEGEA